jgi:hypothetical protein
VNASAGRALGGIRNLRKYSQMRPAILAGALVSLALPAFAQTAPGPSRSPGPPVDLGPRTPDANAAHRGGGVILEGPPGAPAPPVMRTAPHDLLVAPPDTPIIEGQAQRSDGVPAQGRPGLPR